VGRAPSPAALTLILESYIGNKTASTYRAKFVVEPASCVMRLVSELGLP